MSDRLSTVLASIVREAGEADPLLPSIALAVDLPGWQWRGGVDGPLAGPAHGDPADRPFRIASIAKPFTAAAIHRLAATGSLSIWNPIAPLLRDGTRRMIEAGGYDPAAITVAHLLSHTSGIFEHTDAPSYLPTVFASPDRRWSREEQIGIAMAEGSPHGAPGIVYRYSDTGYILLGEIVELATGEALGPAVRRLLDFADIGLAATWWEAMEPPPSGLPPLARQFTGGGVRADVIHPSFDLYGGGGLVSTVDDLARFVRALLTGPLFDKRALTAALVTPPASPPPGAPPPFRTHNYLLASMRVGAQVAHGHTGAWGSAMLYLPEWDAAIAATVNREGADAMAALHHMLAAVTSAIAASAQAPSQRGT